MHRSQERNVNGHQKSGNGVEVQIQSLEGEGTCIPDTTAKGDEANTQNNNESSGGSKHASQEINKQLCFEMLANELDPYISCMPQNSNAFSHCGPQ